MAALARRRPRPSRGPGRAAFTLIEIMCVMFILAVMLMAIVPSLDGMVPKYRLRGGAREVAATLEEGQGQAISTRKEYAVAFDLDHASYWIVLPPKDPDETPADPNAPPAPPADTGPSITKEGRPKDDLEHGLPPPDPAAKASSDAPKTQEMGDREAIEPTPLPTDVVIESVVVGDDAKTSGTVYVPFSHVGGAGSVLVGLKLERGGDPHMWVRFDTLTRTIEFSDERPEVRHLSGGSP